jgi:hypothetical protein
MSDRVAHCGTWSGIRHSRGKVAGYVVVPWRKCTEGLAIVVHTYNLSYLGGGDRRIRFKVNLGES